MAIRKKNYYIFRLIPSKYFSTAEHELLSDFLNATASIHPCLGILDWSITIQDKEKILAVESEFLDLSARAGESHPIELWFATHIEAAQFRAFVHSIYPQLKLSEITKQADRDWMRLWRRHYRPIHLVQNGENLWIIPSWQKFSLKKKSALVARIHPGQAFGTGTHPTTELCLRTFFEVSPHFKKLEKLRILDFGAGTGILAITALHWCKFHKKPGQAVCVEIDPAAREIINRNKKINRVEFRNQKSLPKKFPASLIFANVLAPVLVHYRKQLFRSLTKNGYLILSGLLRSEGTSFAREFLRGYEKKYCVQKRFEKEDWLCLLIGPTRPEE